MNIEDYKPKVGDFLTAKTCVWRVTYVYEDYPDRIDVEFAYEQTKDGRLVRDSENAETIEFVNKRVFDGELFLSSEVV